MIGLLSSAFAALALVWGGDPSPASTALDVGQRPQAIYGGDPVAPGTWSAVVAVTTSVRQCSGTLVTPNLVLTAAHCFDSDPIGPVTVRFGDTTAEPSYEFVSDDWGAHEEFCLPSECGEDLHDFAWVRLPMPVDVEPILPIIDQAEFDEVMVPGTELTFVGYGMDEQQIYGIKREVTAPLSSFNVSGREFRAGGDGKDTCSGDSGGPALVRLASGELRLAGVLSRGGECGDGGVYGIPFPELCWLRDSSGVDLLPAGCFECDCVLLTIEEPDEGCRCASSGRLADRAGGVLFVVLGLFAGARARRRRRP